MSRFLYIRLVCFITAFFLLSGISAQEVREDYSFNYFGIQYSPILPFKFVASQTQINKRDSFDFKLTQAPGYVFGMEMKRDLTRYLAVQTGINFVRRNLNCESIYKDSTVNGQLHFISYEVPVQLMGFVRLTENFYTDISGGLCANFYPSHIAINHFYGQRYFWAGASLIGNVGVEYRQPDYGNFYVGLLYQYHFQRMLDIFYYEGLTYGKSDAFISFKGSYFSLNLKYYFPQNPNQRKAKAKK